MISTCCLNPCLDKTVEMGEFRLGATNRIYASRVDPGGKGVNVARTLATLGMETTCLCALPEKGSDEFLQLLEGSGVSMRTVPTPGTIRTNTKVHDLKNGTVTELNESGVPLSSRAAEAFHEALLAMKDEAEMHVLSGSLPPKASPATYYNLISELAPAPVFLDTSGEALLEGMKARPMFVKPNLSELQAAEGRELRGLDDVVQAAMSWVRRGIRYVCVSLGSEGAVLLSESEALFAPAVPVRVASSVGAGDAMVAGLVYGYLREGTARDALRCGAAAAAASCMTAGTQMMTREDYEALLERVEIRSLA